MSLEVAISAGPNVWDIARYIVGPAILATLITAAVLAVIFR